MTRFHDWLEDHPVAAIALIVPTLPVTIPLALLVILAFCVYTLVVSLLDDV